MPVRMKRSPTAEGDEVSTVLQHRFDPTEAPEAAFTLTIATGPDAGRTLTVDGTSPSRTLLGQSPACELRLTDREVSRRHAALELSGAKLRLTDLDSTNGTFVNGLQILDAYLVGGERIQVGATALDVDRRAGVHVELSKERSFGRLLGASREMRRLYPLCHRLAQSTVPVVIEGETGTGKEVLAECLHEQGPRASGPFVVFDCTAVPPNLVEPELFGHERGAFTGAVAARKGVFEQAHGGTLLIDELGELDIALQPKLLRALERSEVRRVGGDRWLRVDVRVLAATRRDLDQEVQAGRFRDDLFHRLAVTRVELPPLRLRRGDVSLLARAFAKQLGGSESDLSNELISRWDRQTWPGNVRQLRNVVARHLALGDLGAQGSFLAEEEEPAQSDPFALVLGMDLPLVPARQKIVERFERLYVERVLAQHGGNVVHAARASGIARRYFQILRSKRRA
jgi:DNA-binding NtrC family response regulator